MDDRAKEKMLSREKDRKDLESGIKTRDQLRAENGVFAVLNASLNAKPDFIEFLNRISLNKKRSR